jgi:hypothetical protein
MILRTHLASWKKGAQKRGPGLVSYLKMVFFATHLKQASFVLGNTNSKKKTRLWT